MYIRHIFTKHYFKASTEEKIFIMPTEIAVGSDELVETDLAAEVTDTVFPVDTVVAELLG